MFLEALPFNGQGESFPRIRGDVPYTRPRARVKPKFSPHTRGCSTFLFHRGRMLRVFPAYAGMFRRKICRKSLLRGFPRIRGDVPSALSGGFFLDWFSPHTRGCSDCGNAHRKRDGVFPAYAGMFRDRIHGAASKWRFPRIRGDVPATPPLRHK